MGTNIKFIRMKKRVISIFALCLSIISPAYANISLTAPSTEITNLAPVNGTQTGTQTVSPTNSVNDALNSVQLNPQPEPPLPSNDVGNVQNNLSNIGKSVQLNPQPEPPSPLKINATQRVQLNPQPEPPKPLKNKFNKTLSINSSDMMGRVFTVNDKSVLNPGVSVQLNPQPEPPIFSSAITLANSKTATFDLPLFSATSPLKIEVAKGEKSTTITVPDDQILKTGGMVINVKPEFEIRGNKIFLSSGEKKTELKEFPLISYIKIRGALASQGIKDMDNFTLDIQDSKPVYTFTYTTPFKLFWFIPINSKRDATVSAETGNVEKVNTPWYSFMGSAPDLASTIKILPNLVMTNIRFEPAVFSEGQKVRVIGTVTNQGFADAIAIPDFIGGTGPVSDLFFNDQLGEWYFVIIYLKPGESQDFDFTIDKIHCGDNIGIAVAKAWKGTEETSKDDNIISTTANCQ